MGGAQTKMRASPPHHANDDEPLVCRGLGEFLAHDYAPKEFVLTPWLPVRGIAMIAGLTGLGKTYLGLSVAYAIASGGEVLGWKAPTARKVLYVDGEMDPTDLQDRLAAIRAAAENDGNGSAEAANVNLFMICDGDQEKGVPDLAGEVDAGRRRIEAKLQATGATVLMLDNLSCLFRNSDATANEEESWKIAQAWLLSLRRKGVTTVFLHHTGKPDMKTGRTRQRGTSKKEDVCNTSILLRPPWGKDETAFCGKNGFVVTWTKHRNFVPNGDITVRIEHDEGARLCRLVRQGEEQTRNARIAKMKEKGMLQKDIAKEEGLSPGQVSKILRAA